MSFCSLIKEITPKINVFCFVLISSILVSLSCVWILSIYKDVLALYALFTGVMLRDWPYENLCLMFVYVCFVLCLCRDWFCGLIWKRVYIDVFWERVYMSFEKGYIYVEKGVIYIYVIMTEFDRPEVVSLCDWQDVKIHLIINSVTSRSADVVAVLCTAESLSLCLFSSSDWPIHFSQTACI